MALRSQAQAKERSFAATRASSIWANRAATASPPVEYYFGKPLASYTAEDAGKAALRSGISKSPRDYAPAPATLAAAPRNEILALMAATATSGGLAKRCQAESVLVAARGADRDARPRRIATVLDDLNQHGGAASASMTSSRGGFGSRHGGRRVQTIGERGPGERPRPLREAAPQAKGLIQGSVMARQRRRGDPGRRPAAGSFYGIAPTASSTSTVPRARCGSRARRGPLVYLRAFRQGWTSIRGADEPIGVPMDKRRQHQMDRQLR